MNYLMKNEIVHTCAIIKCNPLQPVSKIADVVKYKSLTRRVGLLYLERRTRTCIQIGEVSQRETLGVFFEKKYSRTVCPHQKRNNLCLPDKGCFFSAKSARQLAQPTIAGRAKSSKGNSSNPPSWRPAGGDRRCRSPRLRSGRQTGIWRR